LSIRRSWFLLLGLILLGVSSHPGAAQQTSPPVFNPANGHWYQAVRVAGAISWDGARAAAESLTHAGLRGHLLTITSAAENEFVIRSVIKGISSNDRLWLGGYQEGSASDYLEPAGAWRWVTSEPWSFTHWFSGEPNNYGGNEDALEFHRGERWNDFPRSAGLGGYVVEYESLPIVTGPLFTILPNPVEGGQSAVGQVILTQPAGLGGVVLLLTSSNPAAAVAPAAVTVPTGANTITFPIVTFAVASPTVATISVSSPGGDASARLQVNPPATPPLPPPAPSGNLLINGSFEEPVTSSSWSTLSGNSLPGWRITRGSVDVIAATYWQAAPGFGRQSLDLAGSEPAAIEQSFPTQPGQEYVFSGWMAHNPDNPAMVEGRGNVFLNGQFLAQLYHRDPQATRADMKWVSFAYRFRAAAPMTTLTIEEVTNLWPIGGLALDGLAVVRADGDPGHPGLAAPTNLAAVVVSRDQINLAWKDHSANETGFALFRREGAGPWVHIATVGPNTTRFADLEVRAGATYTYRVQAVRDGEASAWSNEVSLTLAPPEPVPGPHLLVTSHNTHSVLRYDTRTGIFIDAFISSGSGGLGPSHGLIFGLDGNLYVGDVAAHAVRRYNGVTGAFIDLFVPPNSGGLSHPDGMLFGPDGNLYISSYFTNSVLRYDGKTGAFLGAFVPPGRGGLQGPASLWFGWDGNLYVNSEKTHSVLRYDGRTGAFLDPFVPPGSGGLHHPSGSVFGPDGHLYVSSYTRNTVLRYDGKTGAFLGVFIPSASGGLDGPTKLLFGPEGSLYVISQNNNQVLRYDGQMGAFIGIVVAPRSGGLDGPTALAFYPPIPTPPPAVRLPSPPTNLAARAVAPTRIELTWTDNSDNETAFALWRKGGGPRTQMAPPGATDGDWVRIAVLRPNTTSYSDRQVSPDTTYTYRVRATNDHGASGWSNEATARTPADPGPLPAAELPTPSGLTARALSRTQVQLTWAAGIPGATGISVWRRSASSGWARIGVVVPQATTYTDRSALPNTTYNYRLRAHNDQRVSGWSTEASVTTPP
jgi:hypothetical protein